MYANDNLEIAQKTFFWYRAYCVAMAFLSLAVAGLGFFFFFVPIEPQKPGDEEAFLVMGIVYAGLGLIMFLVYGVAALLPPKRYNWIVGIVSNALGFSSCCLWPAVIPLLIYWVKPETQAFFGRKPST